jgi:hypothetical protein
MYSNQADLERIRFWWFFLKVDMHIWELNNCKIVHVAYTFGWKLFLSMGAKKYWKMHIDIDLEVTNGFMTF